MFSLEEGHEAGAGAIAVIEEDGHRFTAYGRSGGSENEASFDAYVNGYNMIQRIKAREAAPSRPYFELIDRRPVRNP